MLQEISAILFSLYLLNGYVKCSVARVDPLVVINQGLLRGQRATDGDYSTFLGVPYAQVDSSNPFGAAIPNPSFGDEIFNAYDGAIECPQNSQSGKEQIDCLRLNIYVPNSATSKNPLPVMVWIHGGGFHNGNAGIYNGRKLTEHEIIVVAINYRLGAYGFMCLDDPAVPGNQGLKDQYLAFQWIRENIGYFGGNPYKITIAGQSAGGASVLQHLYSAKEKLYSKVIAQSGAPDTTGLFSETNTEIVFELTQKLGYNATNIADGLEFLKNTPHNLVTAALSDLGVVLMACKEKSFSGVDNFIESSPASLSNKDKVKNTPILIGYTEKEVLGVYDTPGNSPIIVNDDVFNTYLKMSFDFEETELKKLEQFVRHFYIGDAVISGEVSSQIENFLSDFVFAHPTERAVSNLLNEDASPIYEYLYTFTKDSDKFAEHLEELNYLFPNDIDLSEAEIQHSEVITTLWANFVKYGNPTSETTELIPVQWKPTEKDSRPYMVIDAELQMEYRVNKERMAFWDLFYYTNSKDQKRSQIDVCGF